jgi:hypothetical protein
MSPMRSRSNILGLGLSKRNESAAYEARFVSPRQLTDWEQEAVDAFTHQLNELMGLRMLRPHPNFNRWRMLTIEVFKRYLRVSQYYTRFLSIRFEPAGPLPTG